MVVGVATPPRHSGRRGLTWLLGLPRPLATAAADMPARPGSSHAPGGGGTEAATPTSTTSCPICLDEDVPLPLRAVLTPCFHALCSPCASAWLALKAVCPLCKADVASFLCDIAGDGAAGVAGREVFVEPTQPTQPGAAPSYAPPAWLRDQRRRSGRWGAGHGGGGLQQQQQQQGAPRPYHFRVQRGAAAANAPAAATAPPPPSPPLPPEAAAALARRRAVYVGGLWAARLGPGGPSPASNHPRPPPAAAAAAARAWAGRDLAALCGSAESATGVTLSIALGLLEGRGSCSGSEGGRRRPGEPASTVTALAALAPFLGHPTAAHFWHELTSFAGSGLAVAAYDALVVHSERRGGTEQQGPAAPAHRNPSPPRPARGRSPPSRSRSPGRSRSPHAARHARRRRSTSPWERRRRARRGERPRARSRARERSRSLSPSALRVAALVRVRAYREARGRERHE